MSEKVRVYEIAEEAGASSNDVITKAKDLGIELKSPQSAVSYADAEEIANYIMTGKSSKLPQKVEEKKAPVKKAMKIVEKKEEEKTEVSTTEEKTIEVKKDESPKTETEVANVAKVEPTDVKVEVTAKPVVSAPVKNASDSRRIVPKRRGLKIVKKAKPAPVVKEQVFNNFSSSKKQMKSLS